MYNIPVVVCVPQFSYLNFHLRLKPSSFVRIDQQTISNKSMIVATEL